MSGPPPTPTEILKARGSWRAKTRQREPQPDDNLPQPPRWMNKSEKKVYAMVAKELTSMQVAKSPDRFALSRYCSYLVRWLKHRKFIEKYGISYPIKNAKTKATYFCKFIEASEIHRLETVLFRLEQQFGMTAASRARIQIALPEPSLPKGKGRFFKVG